VPAEEGGIGVRGGGPKKGRVAKALRDLILGSVGAVVLVVLVILATLTLLGVWIARVLKEENERMK
jgi:cobalamin synthase